MAYHSKIWYFSQMHDLINRSFLSFLTLTRVIWTTTRINYNVPYKSPLSFLSSLTSFPESKKNPCPIFLNVTFFPKKYTLNTFFFFITWKVFYFKWNFYFNSFYSSFYNSFHHFIYSNIRGLKWNSNFNYEGKFLYFPCNFFLFFEISYLIWKSL